MARRAAVSAAAPSADPAAKAKSGFSSPENDQGPALIVPQFMAI
jgi:hypothetical protein